MFNVFASLAEFEKDLIRERTMVGLKSARDRGAYGEGAIRKSQAVCMQCSGALYK